MFKPIEELKHKQKMLGYLHSPSNTEIYTNCDLIDNMINCIPNNVWKNHRLTWCDPFCKNGIVILKVIEKLFDSLCYWEPDPKKRLCHIMDNMVFAFSQNNSGYLISKTFIKNICFGDINRKFDIIITDPPFSEGSDTNRNRKPILEFVLDEIFSNCKKYSCFHFPSTWRRPDSSILKKVCLKSKEVVFLNDKTDIIFIKIQKNNFFVNITDIKDENILINLENFNFIPHFMIGEISKIMTDSNDNEILQSYSIYDDRKPYMSPNSNSTFKYKVISSITKSGPKFIYSSEDRGHFGEKKVIINVAGNPYVLFDNDGSFGLGKNMFGIKVGSNKDGIKLTKILKSDIFKNIFEATKFGKFQNEFKIFKYIEITKNVW